MEPRAPLAWRIVAGAGLWTSAAAGSTTAGGTLIALAWAGISRPAPSLIVLTLTCLVSLWLFWWAWPFRPQLHWTYRQWIVFSLISIGLIALIDLYGLPVYLHGVQSMS